MEFEAIQRIKIPTFIQYPNMKLLQFREANWFFLGSFLLIVATSLPLVAQQKSRLTNQQIASIDSTISTMMAKYQVPGVSVAVAKGSVIVWSKGYGKVDLENDVPAKPTTVYRLASVSKSITAVAVMQLVEKGKIDLDVPIQKYVPSFPQKKYPITTRQLLGHLSGVRHYSGEDEFNMKEYGSLSESLEIFQNDTLLHKPETRLTYTTYGYVLLGVIVEAASGISFTDYLQKNIFKPAGMTESSADEPLEIIHQRTRFYDVDDGKLHNARYINSSFRWPGGGLLSSAEDLARFLMALQHGKLLQRVTLQQMTTSLKTTDGKSTHYGLGWIVGLSQHPEVIWHGGVQPGATTAIAMIPQKDLSVVVLTNLGTLGGGEIDTVTGRIISILATN